MRFNPWFYAFTLLLFVGCSTFPEAEPATTRRARELQDRLMALDERVDVRDAEKLATAAVEQARSLAQEYRVVRPPWLHNVLVNHGVRERGLCFEWTNDLFERLYGLDVRTMELHLAVARMDTRREHNSLVVTARGAPFESGLVLDAWRSSGRLWFGPVTQDKYPWVPLPEDRVNPRLKELMESRHAGSTPRHN